MQFALDDAQRELASTVADLVAKRSDGARVREVVLTPPHYDTGLWQTLCQQIGAASLAIPEEYGGAGFSLFETHLVLEQLGAALTPSPLLGSAVLAAQAVLGSGDDEASARLLPSIAEGASVAALAWADADGRWRVDGSGVSARRDGDRWRLDGTARLVLDGADCDVLLAVATTVDGTAALFEVDPHADGVAHRSTPGLDQTLAFGEIEFSGARARALSTDASALLHRLQAVAAIAVTALQVGGAQRCLDLTVDHLEQREQFGRPLGSFQALKHRVADMLVQVETARSASWAAAWSAAQPDTDVAELSRQASVAKSWCSEAFSAVASETVQLHGGIAITWEHDAQLYFKRAHATAELFGRPHEFRRSLLASM